MIQMKLLREAGAVFFVLSTQEGTPDNENINKEREIK